MKKHRSFDKTFFIQNRASLKAKIPESDTPIFIAGNGLTQRSGDTSYPFHQDSYFWYMTGIDEPNLGLLIYQGSEYVLLPNTDPIRDIFDGALDHTALTAVSGIQNFLTKQESRDLLLQIVQSQTSLYVVDTATAFDGRAGMYMHPARARWKTELQELGFSVFKDIRPLIATMRSIKQPVEQEMIARAVSITLQTIADVEMTWKQGLYKYEYELEADITHGFRSRNATGHAYEPIIASGKNATTLHYIKNSDRIAQKLPVLLDVGAEVAHYAADITRCLLPEKPTKRQIEVYDAVRTVQQYALSELKPGVYLPDYEKKVEAFMAQILHSLRLVSKAAARQEVRHYYPHATSHYLGLDVHDVTDESFVLQPGVVLTCEPGIYIPEEEFGIRIEDDILITDIGNTVFTI